VLSRQDMNTMTNIPGAIFSMFAVLCGLGLLTNFKNIARIVYDFFYRTREEMGSRPLDRLARVSLVQFGLPFAAFRLLGIGLVVGGIVMLSSSL
jgi:hypothetical protein